MNEPFGMRSGFDKVRERMDKIQRIMLRMAPMVVEVFGEVDPTSFEDEAHIDLARLKITEKARELFEEEGIDDISEEAYENAADVVISSYITRRQFEMGMSHCDGDCENCPNNDEDDDEEERKPPTGFVGPIIAM